MPSPLPPSIDLNALKFDPTSGAVIREPHPDARREVEGALEDLAGGLADLFVARARQAVARERGVPVEAVDRESRRVLEAARATSLERRGGARSR